MKTRRPIGCGAMPITRPRMPRVAVLAVLALLFSGFIFPPMRSPGVSISKATAADPETAAAEHPGRDAEEDSESETALDDLAAVDPTAATPPLSLTACRRGRPPAHAAWPTAGRQHGADSVRGPPA